MTETKTKKQTDAPAETKRDVKEEFKEKADVVIKDVKVGASGLWKKIRYGADKVGEFAGEATELARLKIDIHNLETNLDKVYVTVGRKLWELHQKKQISGVGTKFTDEFKEIADLQKQIKAKKKKADAINLVEKK